MFQTLKPLSVGLPEGKTVGLFYLVHQVEEGPSCSLDIVKIIYPCMCNSVQRLSYGVTVQEPTIQPGTQGVFPGITRIQ